MDIIKASLSFARTVRNVSRLKEIVMIFGRHGFDEFITRGMTSKIPNFALSKEKISLKEELQSKEKKDWPEVIGSRLRLCFEELGPAFIKFGQLLSSREDIFDENFIKEMKKLRDKVRSVEFSKVKDSVECSLGKKINDIFISIDENPIGTASIGTVYKGVLKSGEHVVIKVKRPGIDKLIETDFSIILFLVGQLEKVSEEVKYLGLSRIVKSFATALENELNFNIEAINLSNFAENLKNYPENELYKVPKLYSEFTRENILVTEFFDGIAFSSDEMIKPHLKEIRDKLDVGAALFFKTFLMDGFFHADLHGGNFFLLKDGNIGIIDFGLMGRLSKKGRQNFLAMIYAIVNFDYENLIYEFLEVAEYEKMPDVQLLVNDVKDSLSPYVGLTVQQTNFSKVLHSVISTLKKHQIFLPTDWFIVFRAMITIDGVGKSVGHDLDVLGLIENDMENLIKGSISKDSISEDLMWLARDFSISYRSIPRHLKWFIKDWAKNSYKFELKHDRFDEYVKSLTGSAYFLGNIVLASVLILCGLVSYYKESKTFIYGIPSISVIFWSLALIIYVLGLKKK